MNLASEQGHDEAVGADVVAGAVHIVLDAREAVEIGFDIAPGFAALDAQLVRQAKRRDAIDDAEIDRLGATADLRGHLVHRYIEHFRRRHGVDVVAAGKGGLELRNVTDMGQDAQFDLRIVGADQLVARLGDEGGADLAAFRRADRDILQVGFVRRQPPGRRRRQVERGMDAPGFRIGIFDQVVGIGALQLRHLAIVEHQARQGHALLGQFLQHLDVGRPLARRRLLAARQLHLVEEDLAQLLRAADIERPADQGVGLGLDGVHARAEILAERAQDVRIDADAGQFHVRQDRNHAAFQRFIDRGHAFARQARLQDMPQTQRDVGVLGGVARRLFQTDELEALGGLAGAGDLLEGDRLVTEMQFRQLVHAVAVQAAFHDIGQQHGVVERGDVDAVTVQNG